MTISILGAGWLGLPLGKALLAEGHTVKGSTTREEKMEQLQKASLQVFLIDLDKDDELPSAFFGSDLLIITLPPGRRDPKVLESYTGRIQKIIKALTSSTVEYLIYTSSTGVYGDQEGEVTESSPLNPTTSSSKAVVQAEKLLKDTGRSLTILRLAGLVGGDRKAGRFLAGKKGLANGEAPVNLVHRDDVVRAVQAIIRESAWNEIFNICADEHPSREVFYTQQATLLGLEPPEFVSEKTNKAFKIVRNEKLKKKLAFSFTYKDPMEFD